MPASCLQFLGCDHVVSEREEEHRSRAVMYVPPTELRVTERDSAGPGVAEKERGTN